MTVDQEVTTDGGMRRHLADWDPPRTCTTDVPVAQRVNQLAATLNLEQEFADGDPLPPLWHWIFFLDWPSTAQLGPDGHPRKGGFLPPIPDRRRMFAGGRLTVNHPLQIGGAVNRESQVASTVTKQGRSGQMLFVTIRHSYRQHDVLRMVEEQDLVYRSDTGTRAPFTRSNDPLVPPPVPWWDTPEIDPALLFRFSALTGNAHRIHYDEQYTTGTEGYPGLVVHGPLLAVWMAELFRANITERRIREFSFTLRRPVFLGDTVRVQGRPDGPSAELAVVSGTNTIHAAARAMCA